MKNVYTYMVMAAVVAMVGVSSPVAAKEAAQNNNNEENNQIVVQSNTKSPRVENNVDRVERNNVDDRVENVKDRVEHNGVDRDIARDQAVGVERAEMSRNQVGKFSAEANVSASRAELTAGKGMASEVTGSASWLGDVDDNGVTSPKGENGKYWVTASERGEGYSGDSINGIIVVRGGQIVSASFTRNNDPNDTRSASGKKAATDLIKKAGLDPSQYGKTLDQIEQEAFDGCMQDPSATVEDCWAAAEAAKEKAEKERKAAEEKQKKEERERREREERERREREERERERQERCQRDPSRDECQPDGDDRCIQQDDCEGEEAGALWNELCAALPGMNCGADADMTALLGMAGGGHCDDRHEGCDGPEMTEEALPGEACDERGDDSDCYPGDAEAGGDMSAMLCMDQDCGNAVGNARSFAATMASMGQNNNAGNQENNAEVAADVEVEVEVESVEEETEDMPEDVGGNA